MKTLLPKFFWISVTLLLSVFNLNAQTVDHCGMEDNLKRLKALDPSWSKK